MKKTLFFFISIAIVTSLTSTYASTEENYFSASNFLAEKWVIKQQQNNSEYNVYFSITRREMLKVMINISWKTVADSCEGRFSDLSADDWGCKYAEAALAQWYIAANSEFRPNDSVTQIEALKMIMQAKGVQKDESDDWRVGYVSKAVSEGILDTPFSDYNTSSRRGWIFVAGAKTYSDSPEFEVSDTGGGLSPEEEELLNHFLNI